MESKITSKGKDPKEKLARQHLPLLQEPAVSVVFTAPVFITRKNILKNIV